MFSFWLTDYLCAHQPLRLLLFALQVIVFLGWLKYYVSRKTVLSIMPDGALSLNDKAYRLSERTVLLPYYILLYMKDEGRVWSASKQLMIFPDQCSKEKFHSFIRAIKLSSS